MNMRRHLQIALLLALVGFLAAGGIKLAVEATDISNSTEWSETDASNSAATNPGWPENMAPSRVNDAARALQGAVKRFWNRINATATATGGGGNYALSYTVAPTTYGNGETFSFKANHANPSTGAALNINSVGLKNIVKAATSGLIALASADISTSQHVVVQYDSGADQFVVVSPLANTGGDVTGPASSVNNGLVIFSGTTGKIIADSATPYTSLKAQGKETIWIPAGALIATTTTGAATGQIETTTNKVNIKVLDYDQSAAEYAQFNIGMPKSWNESTLTATFMWTAASGSGDVIWALQCLAVSNDDALDQAFGSAQTVTDTLITANDNHVTSETSALTCAGTPAEGDLLLFRLYRDASAGGDTLNADARLIGLRLIYTTNASNDN